MPFANLASTWREPSGYYGESKRKGQAIVATEQTDAYLAALFEDSYKRELDADEAIWRSLPFFAAVLGIAVAVLPTVYRGARAVQGLEWTIGVGALLAGSLLCFAIAGRWFWDVVRLQPYRHPPNEVELLDYAQTLASFYADQSGGPAEHDARIRGDLRKLMIEELADAATCNRRNNTAKAHARGQVLLFAMTGFLLAFLAEATILLSEAFVA